MKTNQLITRPMGEFTVTQRTIDGYFDANALLAQWNSIVTNPERRMSRFLESPKTKEFIEALKIDESQSAKMHIGDNQLLVKVRGGHTKNGKTGDKVWMNPLLFIKFAMWINPSFEVKVLRFVYDKMIAYRNEAGDNYRNLSSAVAKLVKPNEIRDSMKKVSEGMNYIVFGNHEAMLRNKIGTEDKQKELSALEGRLAMLINDRFITNFGKLVIYMRTLYTQKYIPTAFR